jgi:hypothetical protein
MAKMRGRRMLLSGRGGGGKHQRLLQEEADSDESGEDIAVLDEAPMMSMMAMPLAGVSLRLPIQDHHPVLLFTSCYCPRVFSLCTCSPTARVCPSIAHAHISLVITRVC